MTDRSIHFALGQHNRVTAAWRRAGRGNWETNARNWARDHGAAGVFRADDSLVLFYRDGTTVRRTTFRHGIPV